MFAKSFTITALSAISTARYVYWQGRYDLKRFWVYILVPVWNTLMEVYGKPAENLFDIVAADVKSTIAEVSQDIETYVQSHQAQPADEPTCSSQPVPETAETIQPTEALSKTNRAIVTAIMGTTDYIDPLPTYQATSYVGFYNPEPTQKRKAGRPKGSKDSRPRKTRKTAVA